MKWSRRAPWFFLVCTAVLLSSGRPTANAQTASQPYVVQYGDTLWDIAGEQLGTPDRWRDIHRSNPHIVNPNLIYPGDILTNLTGADGGTTVGGRKMRSDKPLARPWYGVAAPKPPQVDAPEAPRAIVPSPDFIESSGYIVPYTMKELLSKDFGQITGADRGDATTTHVIDSEYDQIGLVFGDSVYINKGISDQIHDGDVFVAFRPQKEITHPVTGEVMGTQILVLGRLRVKNLDAHISAAEIFKSYNYIEVGDPIMPATKMSLPLAKPLVGKSRTYGLQVGNQLVGHIVAERIGRRGLSYGDIVFLDLGAAQGVQPADNFIIYREIGAGFPKQALGRLTVLSVGEQTATAMIIESIKTIDLGEKIVLAR